MTYQKQGKIIESYKYLYDKVNRKTSIKKYRYGLPEESGEYGYEYDVFGNLTAVRKDGDILREYTYDHFHNRISLKNKSGMVSYLYNAANQLVCKSDSSERFYRYDQRGNLVEITEEGGWINQYTYDCSGRMSEAKNIHRGDASYVYDGLGMRIRTEKRAVGKEPVAVHYCWDITKRYQNLLSVEQGQRKQNYYWGHFLEGIKEDRAQSILLDELGSPLRTVGITGKEQAVYSYDEFGTAMCENNDFNQPFGYTGYLVDEIGGTYFANAREYVADIGRFAGQDLLPGSIYSSVSLNRYIYCRNDSVNYIDLDGNIPVLVVVAVGMAVGAGLDIGFQAYDIYKSGEEITDIENYNLVQTAVSAVSSGVSALIPTATAGLAARFGARAAAGASMLLYAGSGAATEVVLENINNPEATVEDKRWAAFEGAVSSIVGYKAGEAVSLLPIMKRMERAYGYAQMALSSAMRGTNKLKIPAGFYLNDMKALAVKIFSIGQAMDIVTMLLIESFRRLLDVDDDKFSIDNKE